MRGGNSCRQKEQNGDATEDSLKHDGPESGESEHPYPSAWLSKPDPEGENNREESDRAGDEPMAVLVEDSAHHVFERKREHRPAVTRGPIGNRETGTGAGDESSGDEQHDGAGRHELRIPVEPHGKALDFRLWALGFR